MVDNQLDLEEKVQALEAQILEVQEENRRIYSRFDKIHSQRLVTASVLVIVAVIIFAAEGLPKPSALVASLILSGLIHALGLAF